jgi:hypothetical protein
MKFLPHTQRAFSTNVKCLWSVNKERHFVEGSVSLRPYYGFHWRCFKFCCDPKIVKGTLLEEQCTFSAVPPLQLVRLF